MSTTERREPTTLPPHLDGLITTLDLGLATPEHGEFVERLAQAGRLDV